MIIGRSPDIGMYLILLWAQVHVWSKVNRQHIMLKVRTDNETPMYALTRLRICSHKYIVLVEMEIFGLLYGFLGE